MCVSDMFLLCESCVCMYVCMQTCVCVHECVGLMKQRERETPGG